MRDHEKGLCDNNFYRKDDSWDNLKVWSDCLFSDKYSCKDSDTWFDKQEYKKRKDTMNFNGKKLIIKFLFEKNHVIKTPCDSENVEIFLKNNVANYNDIIFSIIYKNERITYKNDMYVYVCMARNKTASLLSPAIFENNNIKLTEYKKGKFVFELDHEKRFFKEDFNTNKFIFSLDEQDINDYFYFCPKFLIELEKRQGNIEILLKYSDKKQEEKAQIFWQRLKEKDYSKARRVFESFIQHFRRLLTVIGLRLIMECKKVGFAKNKKHMN